MLSDRESIARIIDPWAFNGQPAWSEAHKLRCRDDALAKADAILSLPALSVPEGWVAVPREVVEPFARAADWEERCIDPDYGIARVRPLKDSRRVAVTLGECRAVRAALSAIPSPGGEGSSRGLADQPSASRSLNSSAHAPGEGAAE